jgi:hypothetical protein
MESGLVSSLALLIHSVTLAAELSSKNDLRKLPPTHCREFMKAGSCIQLQPL